MSLIHPQFGPWFPSWESLFARVKAPGGGRYYNSGGGRIIYDQSAMEACCCNPTGSLFDIYGIRESWTDTGDGYPHPEGLVRQPTTVFAIDDEDYNSTVEAETHWLIPPDTPPSDPDTQFTIGTLVGGFQTTTEKVWALEVRDGDHYAVYYDAVAKTELFASILSSVTSTYRPLLMDWSPKAFANTQYGSDARTLAAASDTEWTALIFKGMSGGTELWDRFFVDSSGTVAYSTATVSQFINPTFRIIQAMAPRGWPMGAAIEDGDALVGELSWVSTGGGNYRLTMASPTVVETTTDASWIYFDADPSGNWVGVFVHTDTGSTREAVLMINGTTVETRVVDPSLGSSAYAAFNVFGAPHLSHPDETTGQSVVVVPMTDFSVLPSSSDYDGTPADGSKPYIAVIYDLAGDELWRTDRFPDPCICKASSDRWLYLTGFHGTHYQTGIIESSAGVARTATSSESIYTGRPYWLAKHDGSQFATAGPWPASSSTLMDHIFANYSHNSGLLTQNLVVQGYPERGNHDCVHDSLLVEFGIPADATDFVTVIGDGA